MSSNKKLRNKHLEDLQFGLELVDALFEKVTDRGAEDETALFTKYPRLEKFYENINEAIGEFKEAVDAQLEKSEADEDDADTEESDEDEDSDGDEESAEHYKRVAEETEEVLTAVREDFAYLRTAARTYVDDPTKENKSEFKALLRKSELKYTA